MSCAVVSTKNGRVKGYEVKLTCEDAKPVYVYRNIPFAKPPTGSLRFMPPQPADPWTGIRDESIPGNMPMQSTAYFDMLDEVAPMPWPSSGKPKADEDCLHLTVYTTNPEKGKRLPVMVWIYGGGMQMGCEAMYDGSALAGMNDVIVVEPNYRVGVFGFFSLGPASACTGNAGIMDQRMALEWVRDNIEAFGGDKGNVTIFGESAGGGAVNIHVTSPPSFGLFHKAISQSGQSAVPGAVMTEEKRKKSVGAFLKHLKIEETEEAKIVEALQKVPADRLQTLSGEISMTEEAYFYIVVDGITIPKTPEELLTCANFAKVPYMIGCNNTEGFGMLGMGSVPDFETGIDEAVAKKSVRTTMNDEVFEACKKFYIKDEKDEKRFSKLLGNVTGDGMFIAPAAKTASAHHAAGHDVYLYMGAFPLRMHRDAEYGPGITKKADWCVCDHGNDLYMLFGMPFLPVKLAHGARFSKEEERLSREFMAYVSNFARNGDPNNGAKVPKQWPKFRPGGDHIIFAHPVEVGNMFAPDILEFWNHTVPSISQTRFSAK